MVPEGVRDALRYARAFREADLPFMFVGAWAVMVHGWPRSSSDIDVVINLPFAQRSRVQSLLAAMGHERFEERKDEWGERLVVDLPSQMEMEIFFTPPRPPYSDEYARRVTEDIEGEPVPFISPADLALRKLINTRLRRGLDFDDVVGVLHVQKGKIDLTKLHESAALYRVEHILDKALEEVERVEKNGE